MIGYFMTALLILVSASAESSRGPFSKQFLHKDLKPLNNGEDPGEPLFVTPYINKGDILTARKLARVGPLPNDTHLDVESYSGFFTVNETDGGNMFFWFFPAMEEPATAPVLLWLQGGPGGSSLFGLFVENGPIGVKNMKLFPRKVTWAKKYSMLYIDNPVGTGFSFTGSDAGYATNETQVGENLYQALAQFFKMFPELKNNDFYITGESYAGKYIPAVAYRIHKESHPKQVLLRGVAIGDGFSDPPTMIQAYPDLLFNIGAADEVQRDYMQSQIHIIDYLIKQNQYKKAYEMWNNILNGDQTGTSSWFENVTGCTDYYNFQRCAEPSEFGDYGPFLQLPSVRKSIHVGNLTYNSGDKVETMLVSDILQSIVPWLAEIMNYYKVCLYSGQLDIIVGAPLTELMLQSVPWVYLDEYKSADRMVWRVQPNDTEVAGYVRRVHDFYQIIVRGGGHMLPYDQPERSFDMIDRFISGRPFA